MAHLNPPLCFICLPGWLVGWPKIFIINHSFYLWGIQENVDTWKGRANIKRGRVIELLFETEKAQGIRLLLYYAFLLRFTFCACRTQKWAMNELLRKLGRINSKTNNGGTVLWGFWHEYFALSEEIDWSHLICMQIRGYLPNWPFSRSCCCEQARPRTPWLSFWLVN